MNFYAFHAPTPDLFLAQASQVIVRVRVPARFKLESAYIRSEPDNEEFLSPMQLAQSDDTWQIWQGVLKLDTTHEVTLYAFKFLSEGSQYWLSEMGITPYFPERDTHYRYNPHYQAASWVWSQVFYQIFPERFADGDPSNNVKEGEYLYEGKPVVVKKWNERPGKNGAREFYGGDLEGIRQHLDYLQDLGITALYLNPIFVSPSSHKYDTIDYDTIDPHFGSNETFAQLCADLRSHNMRLILDAVVNHTSERHPWFDRYAEHETPGAYQAKESKTRDLYVFLSDDPDSYVGFYGVRTMPILNFANQVVQDEVYKKDHAILRKWMRPPYSIDGWRFDVIHMLGEGRGAKNNHQHVRAFRETLREENPEAYVLGEHFFEASKWLQGDQEDAAMNYYGFTRPIREFLAGVDFRGHAVHIEAQDLDFMLQRARSKIPFPIQLSQFNLLGSHDVARVLTVFKGDVALLKIAITALFTYIGVPCIYYGDEVGLGGGNDPDCRRTFPWDTALWNQDLLEHYKQLIQLRKGSRVLQEGAFVMLYAQGDIYAYARVLEKDIVITVLNRGEASFIELPVWKLGVLEGESVKDGVMRLEVKRKDSLLFHL
jgi:alpha-glucosidase